MNLSVAQNVMCWSLIDYGFNIQKFGKSLFLSSHNWHEVKYAPNGKKKALTIERYLERQEWVVSVCVSVLMEAGNLLPNSDIYAVIDTISKGKFSISMHHELFSVIVKWKNIPKKGL